MVWRSVRNVDCFGSSNAAKYASTSCWDMLSVSVTRSRTVKVTSPCVVGQFDVGAGQRPADTVRRSAGRATWFSRLAMNDQGEFAVQISLTGWPWRV